MKIKLLIMLLLTIGSALCSFGDECHFDDGFYMDSGDAKICISVADAVQNRGVYFLSEKNLGLSVLVRRAKPANIDCSIGGLHAPMLNRVKVFRRDADGKRKVITANVLKAEEHPQLEFSLQDGDIVFVSYSAGF